MTRRAVWRSRPRRGNEDFRLGRHGLEGKFVLETGIRTDFGLVRAWRGDRHGNLVFPARNLNPLCAMAGQVAIAQVEELCEPGEIDPNDVHLPRRLRPARRAPLRRGSMDKRIERLVTREAAE